MQQAPSPRLQTPSRVKAIWRIAHGARHMQTLRDHTWKRQRVGIHIPALFMCKKVFRQRSFSDNARFQPAPALTEADAPSRPTALARASGARSNGSRQRLLQRKRFWIFLAKLPGHHERSLPDRSARNVHGDVRVLLVKRGSLVIKSPEVPAKPVLEHNSALV